MTVKIISLGAPSVAQQISPLPVVIQGGEVRIVEGVPVTVYWSEPMGHLKSRRQITTQDPGANYIDGTEAEFENEFPDAAPGRLHGLYLVSTGNWRVDIDDMYCASESVTYAYYDASDYTYSKGYFSHGELFAPQMATSGIYIVNFAKPIPFKVGLRVSWDSGSGYLYALWSLD